MRSYLAISLFEISHFFPILFEIGKRIVDEKVKGVPLAARVIGSSLRGKGVRYWEAAANRIKEEEIDSSILRSYLNLPVHLKQCFAFCSLFPKDTRLHRTDIVRLWMAHGFVVENDAWNSSMTSVDTGESYFDHLVYASLIEVEVYNRFSPYNRKTNVKYNYKMHDLIHDFASKILGDELSKEWPRTVQRHLIGTIDDSNRSLMLRGPGNLFHSRMDQLPTARSLCIDRYYSIHLPRMFLSQLFNKLSHVRYLDFSNLRISNLPESVCSIHTLQTLILCKYGQITFPESMSQLVNLHHIEAGHNVSRIGGLGRLTKLHSIGGRFILDEGNWQSIEELRNLKQLRGTLAIEGLRHVQCSELACKEQLLQNHGNLKVLVYDMSGEYETSQVLNYLQPPGNVEDLEIHNYNMDHLPTWLGNTDLNIVSLGLHSCRVKKLPQRLLPSLKHLQIAYCDALQSLPERLPPSLENLDIWSCGNLQALPEELPPSLKVFIYDCPLLPEEY